MMSTGRPTVSIAEGEWLATYGAEAKAGTSLTVAHIG